jgi:monothiol glutaredoxin
MDAIRKEIETHAVVLFMKGSPAYPMCGFSRTVVKLLEDLNVPFKGIDILQDPELRANLKIFSDWPTFPQLYIQGQFIGGCDIVRDMVQAGELQALVSPLLASL